MENNGSGDSGKNTTETPSSSSPSSSWWSWFSNLQDDQRMDRLKRCQDLQTILHKCQRQRVEQHNDNVKYDPTSIESFSGGLRTMKYFGWRGILQDEEKQEQQQDGNEEDKERRASSSIPPKAVQTAVIRSCSREQHALWACRAVAVGCGKELGSLKAGFDEVGKWTVLMETRTAYEGHQPQPSTTEENDSSIPCAQLQSILGRCVQKGGEELLQRIQQRNP